MKVKTTELKGNKGVLRFEDAELYFVNSLRRVMLAELPKLAIDDVIIYDNTSALFDEMISHRLGLIPVPTDLSVLSFRSECKCGGKGCPSCTVRYTLSKEGECVVYSGDLQPEHPSFAITDTLIPIVELAKDQRIILEVEAILGRGRDHAKWQVVLAPRYRMDTVISFDKKRLNDVKAFVESLPKDFVVDIKADKLELKDDSKLPMFEAYLEKNKDSLLSVTKDPTKLTFSFETDGSMSAKAALQESINILAKKYEEFRSKLKDI
jgi:DNA-directed RNA polymerase subunit D